MKLIKEISWIYFKDKNNDGFNEFIKYIQNKAKIFYSVMLKPERRRSPMKEPKYLGKWRNSMEVERESNLFSDYTQNERQAGIRYSYPQNKWKDIGKSLLCCVV